MRQINIEREKGKNRKSEIEGEREKKEREGERKRDRDTEHVLFTEFLFSFYQQIVKNYKRIVLFNKCFDTMNKII